MDELKIEDPEDWYKVQIKLRKMLRPFPQFIFDYNRMCKNIEVKVRDLAVLDIEVRKHKDSIYFQQLRKDKLRDINDTIKMFSKILLIASLSKR